MRKVECYEFGSAERAEGAMEMREAIAGLLRAEADRKRETDGGDGSLIRQMSANALARAADAVAGLRIEAAEALADVPEAKGAAGAPARSPPAPEVVVHPLATAVGDLIALLRSARDGLGIILNRPGGPQAFTEAALAAAAADVADAALVLGAVCRDFGVKGPGVTAPTEAGAVLPPSTPVRPQDARQI